MVCGVLEREIQERQASLFIGIDPGASGAIAVIDGAGQIVSIDDMPTLLVRVGKTDRKRIAAARLAQLLEQTAHDTVTVVVEKVWGMTGQSASAAFTFGYGAGMIEGVSAALRLPMAPVTPQAWKKSAGIAADKGAARAARGDQPKRRARRRLMASCDQPSFFSWQSDGEISIT